MLVAAVGLTEVDGAFTLGGSAGSSGGVSIGTTLGGVLLVMMSVNSFRAFVCCNFCCVDNIIFWECDIWRVLHSSFAAWSVRSA